MRIQACKRIIVTFSCFLFLVFGFSLSTLPAYAQQGTTTIEGNGAYIPWQASICPEGFNYEGVPIIIGGKCVSPDGIRIPAWVSTPPATLKCAKNQKVIRGECQPKGCLSSQVIINGRCRCPSSRDILVEGRCTHIKDIRDNPYTTPRDDLPPLG